MNSSNIEETVNNNRSSSTGNEESNRPACAACKHQRKKCKKGCLFLIHFPSNKQQEFSAVHQIFGIANVNKMMQGVDLNKRNELVESIVWEAKIWTDKEHREYGPLGIYKKLEIDYNKLLEEDKQLKETLTKCQQENRQLEARNKLLKETLIRYEQQVQLLRYRCESMLPAVVSRPGELSKPVNSGNSNQNAIQFEGIPQQRHPEQLQAMVPQNTDRNQLENITNTSNFGPIHSSNSRLNCSRYEPYYNHSQQILRRFVGQQHFGLSNQAQENNSACRGVLGQHNHTVNPMQNNFTDEQQTQWKSS